MAPLTLDRGARLAPRTGAIASHGKGLTAIATRVATLMANTVDLHEPRLRLIPLHPGPDRDRDLQQTPRFGARPTP